MREYSDRVRPKVIQSISRLQVMSQIMHHPNQIVVLQAYTHRNLSGGVGPSHKESNDLRITVHDPRRSGRTRYGHDTIKHSIVE